MRAVGIVLQTEVFVDLKQALLLRDGLDETPASRVVAEEPGDGRLEPAIRQARGKFFVGGRDIGASGEKQREDHIGQDLRDARFADERHFFGSTGPR